MKSLTAWPRAIWILIIGMAIQSTGMSFFWPFTTIYVHSDLHHSVAAAGVILMFQSGASVLGSTIGGRLFDRLGGKPTITLGIFGAIITLLILFVVPGFWSYASLVALFGLFTGLISPSMYAFSVTVWPEGGRQAFNAIYVAQNLGVAIGSLTAGLVAQAGGIRSTFLVNAALLAVFFGLVALGFRGPAFRPRPDVVVHRRGGHGKAPRRILIAPLLLLVGLILDWTAYSQWTSTTSSYIHQEGISLPLYSLLWTINGAVILLGQPLIQWLTARLPDSKRQLLVGNVFFLMSFGVLILSHQYAGYIVAMLFTTLGEMLVWPGVPTRTYQITPNEQVGFYQGLVGGAGSAGRMIGPLLGGLLFGAVSRPTLYLIMTAIFAGSSLLYYIHDRAPVRPDSAMSAVN